MGVRVTIQFTLSSPATTVTTASTFQLVTVLQILTGAGRLRGRSWALPTTVEAYGLSQDAELQIEEPAATAPGWATIDVEVINAANKIDACNFLFMMFLALGNISQ